MAGTPPLQLILADLVIFPVMNTESHILSDTFPPATEVDFRAITLSGFLRDTTLLCDETISLTGFAQALYLVDRFDRR